MQNGLLSESVHVIQTKSYKIITHIQFPIVFHLIPLPEAE